VDCGNTTPKKNSGGDFRFESLNCFAGSQSRKNPDLPLHLPLWQVCGRFLEEALSLIGFGLHHHFASCIRQLAPSETARSAACASFHSPRVA
jgi:hypothetical protein